MSVWGGGFTAPLILVGFIAVAALAGFFVLWYESPGHWIWRAWVRRGSERLTGRADLTWVNVWVLTTVAAAVFTLGAGVNWALGVYGCSPGGPSDLITLWTSGHAFLHGGDPFTITACGTSGNPVPAGLASVFIDAVGSLGGLAGILLVWGAVSVAIIPLIWTLSEQTPAIATVWVLVSLLYFPIVAAQVDGASLALVPLAILLTLYLARLGWVRAAAVGGFLSTGRFPALFPILGATGRAGSRRAVAFVSALGLFAAVTGVSVAVYGASFTGPAFFLQFTREGFTLNYWGVLEGLGWLVPSTGVTIVQTALTIALVVVVWGWARSTLGAVAIVLTGIVLLAQFLSFDELVFLLPVALIGTRARWWLWAIGLVAISNYLYLLAFQPVASVGNSAVPSYALDFVLTALLLGLLVELLRTEIERWPKEPDSGFEVRSDSKIAGAAEARIQTTNLRRDSAPDSTALGFVDPLQTAALSTEARFVDWMTSGEL